MSHERHHFTYASDFATVLVQYTPESPALQEVAAAFSGNIKRIAFAGMLPAYLVGVAFLNTQLDLLAKLNLEIKEGDTRYIFGHDDFDEALDELRQAERTRLGAEYIAEAQLGKKPNPKDIGEFNLGLILKDQDSLPEMGTQSILSGMVIGGWTAIETLLSDLWLTALNSHPSKLAALSGKWHKTQKIGANEYDDNEGEEEESKKIDLNDLMQSNYNLTEKMGTILRRKYKWGVLEHARRAYGAAFSSHYDDIKAAVEDSSLDDLSAARNVLVHKAGIVDGEFKRKTKGGPLASLNVEDRIELTGLIVRDLLKPAVERSNKLLKAVDFWLNNY